MKIFRALFLLIKRLIILCTTPINQVIFFRKIIGQLFLLIKLLANPSIYLKSRFVRYFLTPLLLLILALRLSLSGLNFIDEPFQVITQDISAQNENKNAGKELMKGDKIIGSFIAKNENLGIVAVSFNTLNRINNDRLIFRLKEKGQNEWYYEHAYATDQFSPSVAFTFGFPKILTSSNKEYLFEIESLAGKSGDAVALGKQQPVFSIKYEFQKNELFSRPTMLIRFLFDKITLPLSYNNHLYFEFVSFLPLIVYLLFVFQKNVKANVWLSLLAILLLVFLDLILKKQNDSVFFVLISLWLILNFMYCQKQKNSFIIGFFLLLMCPILLISNHEFLTARVSAWAYLFLLSELIISFLPKIKFYRPKNDY